jgi:cyclic pyranopterin monophosphate synthase
MKDHTLTHLDDQNRPRIVDVSGKTPSHRTAIAQAIVRFPEVVWQQLEQKAWSGKKGSILQIAELAGLMGAKKTSDLIPLCHPLGLDHCTLTIEKSSPNALKILCTAQITAKTGVEMEALTGASIAALTVYDMCKGLSHDIAITDVQLLQKTGGKRDFTRHE